MKITGKFVVKTPTPNKFDADADRTGTITIQTDGSPSVNMIAELDAEYGSDAWQGFVYTEPSGKTRYNIKQ
jgi:hypothetical protein